VHICEHIMALTPERKAELRARRLATRKNAPPLKPGAQIAKKHGARAKPPSLRMESIEAELLAALPIRTPDGEAPIHDRPMVSVATTVISRLQSVTAWINKNGGGFHRQTKVMREALRYEDQLAGRAADLLDRLGCSPTSRAKLGVDLVKARDLAQEMSALDVPDADVVDDDNGTDTPTGTYDPETEEWDL
jgi:hypothetical protein